MTVLEEDVIMSKRKIKNKTKHLLEQRINPNSAGIDIGAELIVVAIPLDKEDEKPVRSFGSFTCELKAIRDWLCSQKIQTVAMESTGVYWIPLYDMLEEAGINVCLVNARHIKGVPGKKTDVCDAQWLQQLHAAGLLKSSYRPRTEVLKLRQLTRHRDNLVRDCSKQLQQMQKSLNECNLQLHHVFSDLDGVSCMKILEAILAGQRDPETLWAMRDKRVKAKKETFLKALEGNYSTGQLFIVEQHLKMWKHIKILMGNTDEEIQKSVTALHLGDVESEMKANKKHRTKGKNTPSYDVFGQAYLAYGVDLSTIDGVSSGLLNTLMSELGNREDILRNFTSAKRFCSYLGLCPDNRVSGGKILKSKTKPVANRLAAALRLCAFGVGNSGGEMGQYCRRQKGRLGKAEGITATAHKVARIVYTMIKSQNPYDPKQAFTQTKQGIAKKAKILKKLAQELNYELKPQHS